MESSVKIQLRQGGGAGTTFSIHPFLASMPPCFLIYGRQGTTSILMKSTCWWDSAYMEGNTKFSLLKGFQNAHGIKH